MSSSETPSQTVGPFYAIGLPWAGGRLAVAEGTPGAVAITGGVFDGEGEPVPDALVETWQLLGGGAPRLLAQRRRPRRADAEDAPTSTCRCSPVACSTAS